VDGWTFTQGWAKTFALQTGSLHWDDPSRTLYIGFDTGRVVRLRISEENPMHYQELTELGVHTLRVNGILANADTGSFTSISDDGTLKVTDNATGSVVTELRPSQGGLKSLIAFSHRNCMGISDAKGNLHLFTKSGSPIEHIVTTTVESRSEIKGLALS